MKKLILIPVVCLLFTGCASQSLLEEKEAEIDQLNQQVREMSLEKAALEEKASELALLTIQFNNITEESAIKEETIERLESIVDGKDDIIAGLKELNEIEATDVYYKGVFYETHDDFVSDMILREKENLLGRTKLPKSDDLTELYSDALDIIFIHDISTLTHDSDETVEMNGYTYYKVTDERYNNLEDMRRKFLKTFTSPAVEEFLKRETYIEVDGELYTIGGDAGSLIDQTILLMTIESYNLVESAYTYNIFVKGFSDIEGEEHYERSELTVVYTEDGWKIKNYSIAY